MSEKMDTEAKQKCSKSKRKSPGSYCAAINCHNSGEIVHYQCSDFQKMKKGVRNGFSMLEGRISDTLL